MSVNWSTYCILFDSFLALSRALGDYHLKQMRGFDALGPDQPVIAKPDISVFDLSKVTHAVLMTDGVVDVLSNQNVAHLTGTTDQSEVAREIVQTALNTGTRDNCTALIIDFNKK